VDRGVRLAAEPDRRPVPADGVSRGCAEGRGGSEHAYVGGERLGAGDTERTDAIRVDAEGVDGETVETIAGDPYCARLGVQLRSIEPGRATTRLHVTEELTNFHGTPHGGAVYSVADAAFVAASNSHGGPAVALETNVSYLAAADVGETLVARAEGTHRTRRTAEYEVVVRTGRGRGDDGADAGDGGKDVSAADRTARDGERVATFRGRVYRP
jgi:acyl-CoA thioesterase